MTSAPHEIEQKIEQIAGQIRFIWNLSGICIQINFCE
jgi:hypothetical protein